MDASITQHPVHKHDRIIFDYCIHELRTCCFYDANVICVFTQSHCMISEIRIPAYHIDEDRPEVLILRTHENRNSDQLILIFYLDHIIKWYL